VAPEAAAGDWLSFAYVAEEGSARLHAPGTAGRYEIRYVLNAPGGAQVLARQPLTLTPAAATLTAPDTAQRGEALTVRFTGPRGDGDFVTIVPVGAADDAYEAWTGLGPDSTEWEVNAPAAPGAYEIRYVLRAEREGGQVLARHPLTVR
jgi:Ca-activated chloride channel family protein